MGFIHAKRDVVYQIQSQRRGGIQREPKPRQSQVKAHVKAQTLVELFVFFDDGKDDYRLAICHVGPNANVVLRDILISICISQDTKAALIPQSFEDRSLHLIFREGIDVLPGLRDGVTNFGQNRIRHIQRADHG